MNQKIKTEFAVGIILLVAIVVGGVSWLGSQQAASQAKPTVATPIVKQSVQMSNANQPVATQSAQSPKIIFANIQVDKKSANGMFDLLKIVDFYSVKSDGTELKKMFSLTPDQLGFENADSLTGPYGRTFCSSSDKIYIQDEGSGGSSIRGIEEIDLNGNVRKLGFYENFPVQYKNMDKSEDGFAISPDCSKIIQSVDYTADKTAVNEIYLYDIDGQNKKVLLSQKEDKTNKLKQIVSWSKKDSNIVYLIDAKWDGDGGQQNLYKLNIANGQIQQVALPADCYNYDLSNNENKVACSTEDYDKSSVVDLLSGAREKFSNTSGGKRLFSPSGNGLANEDFVCTGVGDKAKCTNDLYFFDGKQNKKLLSNSSIYGWLSENAILASKDGALVQINPANGEVKDIIKAEYNWLYLGVKEEK